MDRPLLSRPILRRSVCVLRHSRPGLPLTDPHLESTGVAIQPGAGRLGSAVWSQQLLFARGAAHVHVRRDRGRGVPGDFLPRRILHGSVRGEVSRPGPGPPRCAVLYLVHDAHAGMDQSAPAGWPRQHDCHPGRTGAGRDQLAQRQSIHRGYGAHLRLRALHAAPPVRRAGSDQSESSRSRT